MGRRRNQPKKTFSESWYLLKGMALADANPWVSRGLIPLGTRKPFYEYRGEVPWDEVVTIEFDPVHVPLTKRRAMNGLLLAGSGDGKSLLLKNIWSCLHDAGFYTVYIDPKSLDSGRAQKPWHNQRIAPGISPKGIQLTHYTPAFALRQIPHLQHLFPKYSLRLYQIEEREQWQGLGMSKIGASKVTKLVREMGEEGTLRKLKQGIAMLREKDEIATVTMNSMESVLTDLEDYDVVSTRYPDLDLMSEWEEGNAIAISYNKCGEILLTFDVGMRIYRAMKTYFTHNRRTPVMFFLDDASIYADRIDGVDYNFALGEIKQIGFNYRSLAVYDWLAVQSLKIIDTAVAETYRYKIISGAFRNIESLKNIGIPDMAIDLLKDGLHVDRRRHTREWLLVNEENEVETFYPFLPPCNHFQEIYFAEGEEA